MTTTWTYNSVTYTPSTVAYNNYTSFNTYLFSWIGLSTWWDE